MRSAVIVSTARTPIGKAVRGAFNMTKAPTLGALSIREAVARAGIEPGEIDDVVYGSALQQGAAANNVGRLVALRAGLPVEVAGQSMDRQCSSGVMAIATAAKQIIVDRMDVVVGGITLSDRSDAADVLHEEFRDDRYVAAINLEGSGTTHLLYLARAVTPGTYRVPPPQVESMYVPQWRATGTASGPLNVTP